MISPVRNTVTLISIVILLYVVLSMIKSSDSVQEIPENSGRKAEAQPGTSMETSEGFPKSQGVDTTSTEGQPIGNTKVRERPVETAQMQLEKRRNVLLERIESYQRGGIGEVHPVFVRAMDDLRAIEAELNIASDGTEPAN